MGILALKKSKSNAKNVKVKHIQHMKFYLRSFFYHIIILKDRLLANHMLKRSNLHSFCSFETKIGIQIMVATHAVAYVISQYGFGTVEGIPEN